jgi:hypothetical protein
MKTRAETSPEPEDRPDALVNERSIQVFAVWIDGDDMVLPAIPPDVPARFGWAYAVKRMADGHRMTDVATTEAMAERDLARLYPRPL